MHEQNSTKLELDNDLLASHAQRFANYLIDYICQVVMMFGAFVIILMIASSSGNKNIVADIESVTDVVKYA